MNETVSVLDHFSADNTAFQAMDLVEFRCVRGQVGLNSSHPQRCAAWTFHAWQDDMRWIAERALNKHTFRGV